MATTRAAARQTSGGVPRAGRYRLDPGRSSVTFRTRHLFGLGVVSGTMAVTGGEITLDPATPSATVTAVLSAASFSTGNRARDRDVRSTRFLDTGQYPDIRFRAGMLSQSQGRWALAGELEVRRVREPVTLVIDRLDTLDGGFRVRATARVDRYAFGLTAAKGMAARYLDIELEAAMESAEEPRTLL